MLQANLHSYDMPGWKGRGRLMQAEEEGRLMQVDEGGRLMQAGYGRGMKEIVHGRATVSPQSPVPSSTLAPSRS